MLILNDLWIILALPLLGAALNGLFGKNWPKSVINSSAVGSVSLSFLTVLEMIREFARLPAEQIPWVKDYFTWFSAGSFRIDFALGVDQLTIVMLLVVTFVSSLVHIYSVGYMAHEDGYYRFFSYLNLFVFFMLTLVLASNLVVMFVGWEGVGLCSYLLIGFWFLKLPVLVPVMFTKTSSGYAPTLIVVAAGRVKPVMGSTPIVTLIPLTLVALPWGVEPGMGLGGMLKGTTYALLPRV